MADVVDFPNTVADQIDREVEEALRLLPAWFTGRMMTNSWSFGLLLETGHTLCIELIVAAKQGADGTVWLDVEMMTYRPCELPKNLIVAPTSRTRASVQASKIVAAFELADT